MSRLPTAPLHHLPDLEVRRPFSKFNRRGRHPYGRLLLALVASGVCKALIPALGLWPRHYIAAVALFTGPDLWILAGILVPNATWLAPMITRFAAQGREVWLTIDDGPEPATTPRLLDLLDEHAAQATFFVIGEKARAHPELVAEILRRGHTIGNHTDTHPVASFWLAGPWRTRREFVACRAAVSVMTDAPLTHFRPPAGICSLFLPGTLAEYGAVAIGWSARGREQLAASIEAPLRRLKRGVTPGAILLVHESARFSAQRLALATALLEHLARERYRCVVPAPEQLTSRR